MDFLKISWADSNIECINIEYDLATLTIWNDALKTRVTVQCSGFAGITNLCIWDDTIILTAEVNPANNDDPFVRNLYTEYDKNYDYGGRNLSNGLLELRIELVNHIAFSVYCQKIDVTVTEKTGDDSVS